jgi:hypothetical protein
LSGEAKPIVINSDYIYPKIHKKSKRQTPEKRFACIEKRYLNNFEALRFGECWLAPEFSFDSCKAN